MTEPPLAFRIVNWIGIIDQLASTEANRVLRPLGLQLPQFVMLNHFSHRPDEARTVTSVARYVFDLGDWERSAWIVPLGASGHPGSPHYADQSADWSATRLRPMRYGWARISAEADSHQRLEPASHP